MRIGLNEMKLPIAIGNLARPLSIGFLVAIATAGLSLLMPNYYRSEARILPVESKTSGNFGQVATAAAALGFSVPGQDSGDGNFVEILNSRWMLENIVNTKYSFHARSWRFGPEELHNQNLLDYFHLKNIDQGVSVAKSMFLISRDIKSKLLVIAVETKSPELSQQMVQNATKLLESFVLGKTQTRGGSKAIFAQARLQDARKEMTQAESVFRDFLAGNRNYLVSNDPTVRLTGARLEAELKLRQQMVLTLAISHEQALMEEKNDLPILNVMDLGNLPINKSRPARAMLVLSAFFFSTAAAWLWLNKKWVLARLRNFEDGGLAQRLISTGHED
jgi:uncharacterized protein involved in exopolysaccharide biosynthesis